MDENLKNFLDNMRSHCLYMCRGYWQGTTCSSKRRYQEGLLSIRQIKKEYQV